MHGTTATTLIEYQNCLVLQSFVYLLIFWICFLYELNFSFFLLLHTLSFGILLLSEFALSACVLFLPLSESRPFVFQSVLLIDFTSRPFVIQIAFSFVCLLLILRSLPSVSLISPSFLLFLTLSDCCLLLLGDFTLMDSVFLQR